MNGDSKTQNNIYKLILESLSGTTILLNHQLIIKYINPAAEMFFEISALRLEGMAISELFFGENNLPSAIKQALRSGNPFTERELEIRLPMQRIVTADCTVTPLKDNSDNDMLLMEIKQLDRSLRISKEEKQFNQSNALRTLIRGLAHEVKNPLGGLRGAAQLLERELPNESLKEYTNIIIGEADRLRNLVNQLLGPSTLPKKERVNIHEVIEHVRQLADADSNSKIRFSQDYDPSIPDLYADRDQLIQAILNIVKNAQQAMEYDGEIILRTRTLRQFTIGHTRHKLVCNVDIIDNGPGITDDLIESIFFPMVTNRANGTGLGLSISQSLIQQHHGSIQCSSKSGLTIFSVMLPLS